MKRRVKMEELSPEWRAVVLALIDAQSTACARGQHVMRDGVCRYASAHR